MFFVSRFGKVINRHIFDLNLFRNVTIIKHANVLLIYNNNLHLLIHNL